MSMLKKICLCVMICVISLSTFVFAYEGSGWYKSSDNQWYLLVKGEPLKNTWAWIDDNDDGYAECYYFSADGIMLRGTGMPDNHYKVDKEGRLIDANGIVAHKKTKVDISVVRTPEAEAYHSNEHKFEEEEWGKFIKEDSIVFNVEEEETAETASGPFGKCYSFVDGSYVVTNSSNFENLCFKVDKSKNSMGTGTLFISAENQTVAEFPISTFREVKLKIPKYSSIAIIFKGIGEEIFITEAWFE